MKIGYFFWEGLTLAGIIFGALAVFWLRGVGGKEQARLWVRFSLLLFGVCMFGLIVGSLLSQYGFGSFLLGNGGDSLRGGEDCA
jgi:hypothetical protein